jgi:RNA polymerase sigma-70 factor (TIGR02943 family)
MDASDQSRHRSNTVDPMAWVDRHGDTLFRYALSRLRDPDAAEEVVQETFVAALRAIDQYSGAGAEVAWLLGILKRKIIDCVRRRNRPDAGLGTEAGEDLTDTLFDKKGNWRSDPRIAGRRPEALLEREEFWQAFRGCLNGLPQRQADVFSLREVEDLSSDTVCQELQITPSNLWVLLHRARLRLMKCMKTHLENWGER